MMGASVTPGIGECRDRATNCFCVTQGVAGGLHRAFRVLQAPRHRPEADARRPARRWPGARARRMGAKPALPLPVLSMLLNHTGPLQAICKYLLLLL
jgi:hypothetical protein